MENLLANRRAGVAQNSADSGARNPYRYYVANEGLESLSSRDLSGEMNAGEEAGSAAIREFTEETGIALTAPLQPLGEIRQRAGKRVLGFAVEGDLDVQTIKSNSCEIEWPPRSGMMQAFPEIDRAEWFDLPVARGKILDGQRPFLDRLAQRLGQPGISRA